jgi:hypothetical protein
LRLDKDGGTWINTPRTEPGDSRTERKAHLKLTSSGTLEGKVTVTYSGQEALWRRLEEHNEDDADRKQFLENQIKADIPTGSEVELSNRPDWDSASRTLIAEYDLKIPGWAASAGQRLLLPVGLFGAQDKRAFQHTTRIHPLYFNFARQSADEVSIELPANWQVSSVPKPRDLNRTSLLYSVSTDGKNGSLLLNRELTLNMTLVNTKYYASVQDFFQTVRAGDEEQVILLASKNPAVH